MKRFIIASIAACGVAATPALAETAGTIVSVSGGEGAVVVLRSGQTIAATPSLALQANDRVIVRADGAVDVAAEGCNVSLAAPAMAVVNDNFCAAQPTRLGEAAPRPANAAASGGSVPLRGAAAATSAGAGAIAVAAAAAGGSGGGSSSGGSPSISDSTTGSGSGAVGSGSGGQDSGPVTGNFGSTFDPGSGLDDGLFGFFESTSS